MVRERIESRASDKRHLSRPWVDSVHEHHGDGKGPLWSSTSDLLGRVGFLALSAYAFSTGLKLYEGAGIWPWSVRLSLLLYLCALSCLGGAFLIKRPMARLSQATLGVVLLVTLGSAIAYQISYANPGYGTDAIAFAHAGADELLAGENPYEVSGDLGPVLDEFGVPETFVTRSQSGEPIDRLVSYPGGHVLAYTAGALLGLDDMRWVTALFELAAIGLMWLSLMPVARSLLVLVLLIEPNVAVLFTSGGVTDWLWVFPLLIAALGLIRGKFGWAGIAVGVACAMKQQPWFAVPFILVWVYKKSRHSDGFRTQDAIVSFSSGLFAAFAVLNLPFILWSPNAWIQSVLTPALSDLVPDGQGLSILASRGILALPQEVFALSMVIAFGVGLYVYARSFDRMQDLLWVLPAAVFLFSYRSFHNYFVYWLPVALFWLCQRSNLGHLSIVDDTTSGSARHRTLLSSRPVVAVIGMGVLAVLVALVLAGGPALKVGAVTPNVEDGVLTSLDVEVTNTTSQSAIPVVDVFWGGWPVPWKVQDPQPVLPGDTLIVRALPGSSEVIPAADRAPNGDLIYKPFRVRVNPKGEGGFDSSGLVDVSAVEPGLINPSLAIWGRSDHTSSRAPFGWSAIGSGAIGPSLDVGPVGGGKGAAFSVIGGVQSDDAWSEVGLVQDVSRLSVCYEMRLQYSPGTSSAGSLSTGSVGLQVIQESASLWFVPSTEETTRVSDLPGNTRIVELPTVAERWSNWTLQLDQFNSGTAVDIGEPTTLKLYNALHVSESGSQHLSVSRISEC